MLRSTGSSAPSTADRSLAMPGVRPDMVILAQLLAELARPWRVIASQLLLMVEPLCTPEQRQALRHRAGSLVEGKSPLARGAGRGSVVGPQ
ncbi:MAG: hypothetical protein ACYCYF_09840 [Anaerolineae bacterium]